MKLRSDLCRRCSFRYKKEAQNNIEIIYMKNNFFVKHNTFRQRSTIFCTIYTFLFRAIKCSWFSNSTRTATKISMLYRQGLLKLFYTTKKMHKTPSIISRMLPIAY